MPKKRWWHPKARLEDIHGDVLTIMPHEAHRLMQTGNYELVSVSPIRLREIDHSSFNAELKSAKGVVINAITERDLEWLRFWRKLKRMGLAVRRISKDSEGAKRARRFRTRPKSPHISESEREFRRYKNGYLARDGREGERAAQDVVEQVRGKKKGRRR